MASLRHSECSQLTLTRNNRFVHHGVLQVLENTLSYPTTTTITVVTNKVEALENVLLLWRMQDVIVKGQQDMLDNHTYALLWEHRSVMEEAHSQGVYQLFVHSRKWSSLKSRALHFSAATISAPDYFNHLRFTVCFSIFRACAYRVLLNFTGRYTAYIYMEDDTYIPWTSLLSWGVDESALSDSKYTRGFYRTEVIKILYLETEH